MAKIVHSVAVADASSPLANPDRLGVLLQTQIANGVGGGAGAAVAIAITGLELPATYNVQLNPSQDATVWVSARSQTGFTVNIAPRLAATTLSAGAIDVLVTF